MSEVPLQITRRRALRIFGGVIASGVCLGTWIASEESKDNSTSPAGMSTTTTTTERSYRPSAPDPERPSGEQLSIEQYVVTYKPYAERVQSQFGIDANVVLAQSYVETGGASSELAMQAHAFFGIKAKDDWSGPTYTVASPEEPTGGGPQQDMPSAFRQYDTVLDSFLDYGDRITNSGYYDDAVAVISEPEEYIAAIAGIYATDSAYTDKLLTAYREIVALD